MKIELKPNVFIQGFDDLSTNLSRINAACECKIELPGVIFIGKIDEITEELAKECVIQNTLSKGTQLDNGEILKEDCIFGFKQYKKGFGIHEFKTAKESIQSACDKEYCIIWKTKTN